MATDASRHPLLIVNPAASAGRLGRVWPQLAAEVRSLGIDFDEALTSRPGNAVELAKAGVRANRPSVIAVGGDGLLNEVVNGFFENDCPIPTETTLGLIPFGTGNDTRRTFGIPVGRPAARLLVEGHPRAVDIGHVRFDGEVRYFINIAEAGIGAEVADRMNRAPKHLGGRTSVLVGTLGGLSAWRHKPMRTIVDGEQTLELEAQAVTVANCRFYGSGMLPAPMAQPDDGFLDVIVTGAIGKIEGLRGLRKLFMGTHLDDPRISRWIHVFRAKTVEVSSPAFVRVQLDGELAGRLPATFGIIPRALRLVVPTASL
jgi:diacylglycerol kinase (ATP)